MISIHQPGRQLGTVDLVDGKLIIKDESDGFLTGLLKSMGQEMSDEDLYGSLSTRLKGWTYAVRKSNKN